MRLDKHWGLLHRPIMHDDCTAVPAAPPMSDCCQAGMCLCTGIGLSVKARADKFLRYISSKFTIGSEARTLLSESRIVFHLTSRPHTYEGMVEGSSEDVSLWLHIGHMQYSPI